MQPGITGFVRIPNSQDPNKVYALGSGGRPIKDEQDLMLATGASSVAQAWQIANVQLIEPSQAIQYGITATQAQEATQPAQPAQQPASQSAATFTTPSGAVVNSATGAMITPPPASNVPLTPPDAATGATTGATTGSGQFASFVKTADNPTIYGVTAGGQYVGFQTEDQFKQAGGDFNNVQIIKTAPDSFIAYPDYLKTPSSGTFDYKQWGITDAQWNAIDSATQAFVASTAGILKSQYDQGQANASINSDLLNKAMAAAANDPDIKAKYGDSLAMAQSSLQKNLGFINEEYGQTLTQEQKDWELASKNLKEQQAAAGTAYSGFREQAQQKLDTDQSGIIASTKRSLQQNLNALGQGIESQFGSGALSNFAPLTSQGLSYTPAGGIMGTDPLAKKADVYNKGLSEFSTTKIT